MNGLLIIDQKDKIIQIMKIFAKFALFLLLIAYLYISYKHGFEYLPSAYNTDFFGSSTIVFVGMIVLMNRPYSAMFTVALMVVTVGASVVEFTNYADAPTILFVGFNKLLKLVAPAVALFKSENTSVLLLVAGVSITLNLLVCYVYKKVCPVSKSVPVTAVKATVASKPVAVSKPAAASNSIATYKKIVAVDGSEHFVPV